VAEQTVAATQVAVTTKSMGRQSDQIARGMTQQSRAARDIMTSIDNISKNVGSIAKSNRANLDSSSKVMNSITEIRQVAVRNTTSAKSLSTGANGLTERARKLAELVDSMEGRGNGNAGQAVRRKSKKAGNPEGV
jgi:methyl-accepting chemotaxis protein